MLLSLLLPAELVKQLLERLLLAELLELLLQVLRKLVLRVLGDLLLTHALGAERLLHLLSEGLLLLLPERHLLAVALLLALLPLLLRGSGARALLLTLPALELALLALLAHLRGGAHAGATFPQLSSDGWVVERWPVCVGRPVRGTAGRVSP
ncbi:hypothetical protein [Streptomyces umbrinus]|uniref:hypothetical protein n=1 Tax=Streptomyces umbrinus TaxID=67370 RepID=UPI0027D778AE|nr:hypothetical protein [Streptomyces umbrinus]